MNNSINYQYKNCPVPGGGFVTGLIFHKKFKNIIYARTDIGGVYRYDFNENYWHSLVDHVTQEDTREAMPLGIALDNDNADALILACGCENTGKLCISYDKGETFTYKDMPCKVNGNGPGRGAGERLHYINGVLYYASMSDGLMISSDMGDSWEFISIGDNNETNLAFIWLYENSIDKDIAKTFVVSTTGEKNKLADDIRGHSLYITYNGGESFEKLPQPSAIIDDRSMIKGFVAQRCAFDGKHLYVTFTQTAGEHWRSFDSITCDTGNCFDGRIYRYEFSNGKIIGYKDITPKKDFYDKLCPERTFGAGLSGVDYQNGVLVCSSTSGEEGNIIYVSTDNGESYTEILNGLAVGEIDFNVDYMKPKYNGNSSIIHWMSDVKINPFDNNMAVFNTGTGIFCTKNLLNYQNGTNVSFHPICNGVEETVHLNVYGLPEGEVKVLDIIGDLGGFAFTELDTPCENSFANADGDRYITCINADFPDKKCSTIVATPRGNWTGQTKGGVIITHDQCKTWELIPQPFGLTNFIDSQLKKISKPNVDSGWVAITSDAGTIIWVVGGSWTFPIASVCYTDDEGKSWALSKFFDNKNHELTNEDVSIKVYSDRVNPNIIYGIDDTSRFFISNDKGRTFKQYNTPKEMKITFKQFQMVCESGNEGSIYLSSRLCGLWKISYNTVNDTLCCNKISKDSDTVYCIGLGKNADNSSYKTIFINGNLNGEYGFYRSINGGESFDRINNSKQMFGQIIAISGDPREFGRFYLATGSKGLVYGEEIK